MSQKGRAFGRLFLTTLQFLCGWETFLNMTPAPALAADPGGPVSESPDGLEELMALFAESGGVRAEFTENRYLSILTEPIETSGVLYFSPPAYLARYTVQPDKSSIVTNGKQVALRDTIGTRTIDLGSSDLARELVSSFAVLLSGDFAALTAHYDAEFYFEEEHGSPMTSVWTLDLKPRSAEIRDLIQRTRVRGRKNRLTSMETLEKNGDRTLMLFSGVETGVEFDDEELDALFSLNDHDRGQ